MSTRRAPRCAKEGFRSPAAPAGLATAVWRRGGTADRLRPSRRAQPAQAGVSRVGGRAGAPGLACRDDISHGQVGRAEEVRRLAVGPASRAQLSPGQDHSVAEPSLLHRRNGQVKPRQPGGRSQKLRPRCAARGV
eukprot:scaffold8425_cov107-Isochrysis_galbana.AAC.4